MIIDKFGHKVMQLFSNAPAFVIDLITLRLFEIIINDLYVLLLLFLFLPLPLPLPLFI
jgi:hypothetical protein